MVRCKKDCAHTLYRARADVILTNNYVIKKMSSLENVCLFKEMCVCLNPSLLLKIDNFVKEILHVMF
jgi:hypothetical protein